MNILFVRPGEAKTSFPHQYAVLSAYVKTLGHNVNLYDAALSKESVENVFRRIDFKRKDAVCMSVLTGWHNWASRFTALVKEKYPLIKVIVGGSHISALKEYAQELLLSPQSHARKCFSEKEIKSLFMKRNRLKDIENTTLLWRLLVFEIWHNMYIKGK